MGWILHTTQDGGRNWSSHEVMPEGLLIPFRAPADGRYGFRLSAVDAVGARAAPPAPGDPPSVEAVLDTAGPEVRVLRPERTENVHGDGQVEIEWAAHDENLGPLPVEVSSSQEGGPWETVWRELPASGKRTWHVPLLPGEVRLRFRARDLAGNASEVIAPGAFRVTGDRLPSSRWVAAPPHSKSRKVEVYYRVVRAPETGDEPVPPEELRRVQWWWRSGGLEWIQGGVDPDRRSPLAFQAPQDGWFELLVAAVDRQGNWIPPQAAPGPDGKPDLNQTAHVRFLVDTLEPRVAIESPVEGAWLDGGGPLVIRYTVDEENPRGGGISVSSSLDGGGSWTELASGLEAEPVEGNLARGELRLDLPSIESERFLLRVEAVDQAGNAGSASTRTGEAITIRNAGDDPARKADEHYRRGLLLLRSGDPAERTKAVEAFRRAVAYLPGHAAAHHDLGVALESMGGAPETALQHFRRAHAAASDDSRLAMDLVGVLLRRAEVTEGDAKRPFLEEAEAVFGKISWSRLVELASEDRVEAQRLRQLYRRWKDLYFNRPPR